ncbi:MAG: hypothetical protein AMXMBFR82_26270 [Candidatus Hydrogenedentota bacterium]
MARNMVFALVAVIALGRVVWAADLAFLERFALADDRAEVLKELVPGTEDYYYFHCLYSQQTGRFDEVDKLLETWIERYGQTPGVQEIRNRQALLLYSSDPERTLEYLKAALNLDFSQQRQLPGEAPDLPSQLDPESISRATLLQRALDNPQYADMVNGFTRHSYDWLLTVDLSEPRLRGLLQSLDLPDYPNLPALIAKDLSARHSGGFGSLPVHTMLVREQLDELLVLKPELLNNDAFVFAYLQRLRPSADEPNWRIEPEVYEAYLERLAAFTERLAPAHNSLKSLVQFHRLQHDMSQGVFDRARFIEYLRLPRQADYVNPAYLRSLGNVPLVENVHGDHLSATNLNPPDSDALLVRQYLMHFFATDEDHGDFETYVREDYLRRLFAETKLVQEEGDLEQWYSWLDPASVDHLKKQVDVEFVPENRARFAPDEDIRLQLWIKNVERLLVKVYAIDAKNYYQQFAREVNIDIDLDGLVPNHEEVHTYSEAPLRRVKREFGFPELTGRGVWVIEFVGNGKSSRAVVHKGRLQYVCRTGPAGQMITVLNETGQPLPKASVWFSGNLYAANEDGEIAIPFSTDPGQKPLVLCDGDFAALDRFQHEAEEYRLVAGFHVDSESLRAGQTAQVAVRPLLYLNGAQIPVGWVREPALTIRSTTGDGITSTQRLRDISLHGSELFVHRFRVPDNLAELRFTLTGSIDRLTNPETVDVVAEQTFPVNGINKTEQTAALFLSRVGEETILEARDKTGFPLPGHVVYLHLNHVDFVDPVDVSLKTDVEGRIVLGSLPGIEHLSATGQGMNEQHWDLRKPEYNYPHLLQGDTSDALRIPFSPRRGESGEGQVTLMEVRDGAYVADRSDALTVADGFVTAAGLPGGDYLLHLKSTDQRIHVRLTEGVDGPYFVASENRVLEVDQPTPLQVKALDADDDTVTIRLANANDHTRVHVTATCYHPDVAVFDALNVTQPFAPDGKAVNAGYALYQSGRFIGDEYRYILERRFAAKFPGNMLERPSLLLNPWAVQETQAEQEAATAAEPPPPPPPPPAPERQRMVEQQEQMEESAPAPPFSPSYDFLGSDPAVFYNLKPDGEGVVTIPRADLQGRQYLQIVATDPFTTVTQNAALPERDVPIRDLRLAKALDPAEHYVEKKRVRVLEGGETLQVSLTGEAQVQTYDSIPAVYALYLTLHGDPKLREFQFVTRWSELTPDEKREQFSKYASHELNFFLYHKDKAFFDATVRSFLDNKAAKTFLDHWLLGDDLSEYLQPWQYGQLNLVEKILLAQRVSDEGPHTQRYVQDAFDMIPPNPEWFNALFMTALYGGALAGGSGGSLQNVQVGGEIRVRENYFADRAYDVDGNGIQQSIPFFSKADGDQLSAGGGGAFGGRQGGAGEPAIAGMEVHDLTQTYDGPADELDSLGFVEQRTRLNVIADFDEEAVNRYRALYRAQETTREWVENNYFKLPIHQQSAGLIPVSAFWLDFVQREEGQPFRSEHLAEAANSFTEILLALAVLDLPFEGSAHETASGDTHYAVKAASPLVAFYKDIEPAEGTSADTPVLVSQNFFRLDDQYRHEGNQRFDKFVTDEFLSGVVYGCQVTVTNPTSTPHNIELLRQVPEGSIPVAGGRYTKSERMRLEPYSTATIEYHFYFPEPGEFSHYPVHVSEEGALLAFAEPHAMRVVEEPSTVDTTSWQYVSQQGTSEEVLEFLRTHNLNRIELSSIAWRMRDREFYEEALALIRQRHVYQPVLWAFAVYHNDSEGIETYMQYRDDFVAASGPSLESPLLTIDPVERKAYQHVEYAPLINPRAHDLDNKWSITNEQFRVQFASLMNILAHRATLDDEDLMAVTYYMLLQDRVADALRFFDRVQADKLETRVQHDYFAAYLALYEEDPDRAARIAGQYKEYPVERWRDLFGEVRTQVAAITGGEGVGVDGTNRMAQDQLAAEAPRLELEVKDDVIVLHHMNLESCRLSFYPIDVEMLFTRNPFAPAQSSLFAGVKPAEEQTVQFDPNESQRTIPLPDAFADRHVVIQAEAAGINRTSIRFASSLIAQLIETYGQVHVVDKKTNEPRPKVYVKVFADMENGGSVFYKDGYTDLRGRFDYASSSTLDVGMVRKFAILVLDEERGAKILTATPPGR